MKQPLQPHHVVGVKGRIGRVQRLEGPGVREGNGYYMGLGCVLKCTSVLFFLSLFLIRLEWGDYVGGWGFFTSISNFLVPCSYTFK